MFSFLKPAPDAKFKIPNSKVHSIYRLHQLGVLVAIFIGYAGYNIIRQVFSIEQHDLMQVYHFSRTQIGIVLSCFGVGYGISKLFMGALSDKSNPNHYLATGLIISSVLNFCFGTTKNFLIMCGLMLLMAIAQGMGAGACQRIIQIWWGKKQRGLVYAIWGTSKSCAAIICVSIVNLTLFLFSHSLRMVFFSTGILGVILAIIVLIVGNDRPTSVGLPSIEDYTHDEVILDNGKKIKSELTNLNIFQILYRYIIKDKLVWAVTLTSMCLYVVNYGINSWIPSYLTQFKGFDPNYTKWLVGIVSISIIPVSLIIGFLSGIFKNYRGVICFISMLGVIICLSFYFLSTNHTLIVISLILLMNFLSAPTMLVGLIINEVVPKFAVGTSTGFMGFFQYIVGEIAATAFIGYLVDQFGWTACIIVLYVAAGLSLIFLIYIIFIENKLNHQNKKI